MHNQVKIQSHDSYGRESLAQYILRPPSSQQKLTYRKDTQTVLYRSKMNPTLKRNFAVFPVLDWIAAITAHIPNKGEQIALPLCRSTTGRVFVVGGRKTHLTCSLIESCEVQNHHDRFQSTSGATQNMTFWGPPLTVLKTHIYVGLF